MSKRWTESELRFIKDNAEKMSVQSLADSLSVRIDELEKRMEKLGLSGAAGTPAAKKPLTMKELSRHTENARKDFDRGVAAIQKTIEPEDFYYAAVLEKNRGNVPEAIEHLKRAARKNGGGRVDFLLACCYAQSGEVDSALLYLKKAIEEDQSNRILARHDRDFDALRDTPSFQELLAS